MTVFGAEKLRRIRISQNERRPKIIADIAEARAGGDLKEKRRISRRP